MVDGSHDGARSRILSRLRAAPPTPAPALPEWRPPTFEADRRLDKFRAMFEAMRAEVHDVAADAWPQRLRVLLDNKGVRTILVGEGSDVGAQLAAAWADDPDAPRLAPYDRPVEALKDGLVNEYDAALTMARSGIAETGSLVLWPDAREPRLMSLLPPIHIALVDEDAIRDTLAETIRAEGWAGGMPTNVVVVSGPSKTADIEQTLAFGVHGPKELIVLVLRKDAET